ncbi:brefeldin A-inhibited guanine nucleotide-exchange protein 1-like isoform X2 [Hibiscus syriacus]|uniref:brefeldin A-inhibited guanine nucleotide-exchange protein 1-like isoform X2 n=1 Tax=Hibiscus syriacus TaxID=106335 RepID=UPI001922B999|nr:brefeldin A-inhibited guanine nucleotide-exchange protein 1-like isoform X2 [Hibiscus syriacus]
MLASQTLGGPSRCGRVLGPPLDKIIKNSAWRKHTHLVSSCKSSLDKLETLSDTGLSDPTSPLLGISSADANFVLNPIQLALETNYAKVAEPALECTFKLFSFGLFRGEIHNNVSNPILYKIVEGVCTVGGIGEESLDLAVLRVLLAAIRCPCVLVRGECLINVVRTCYNIYLRGLSGTNQICAKSVLAQIILIVFTRAEEDSIDVPIKTVFVSELLEFSDKTLNEGSSIYHCQNFVSEVMNASEGVPDLKLSQPCKDQELQNVELKVSKWEEVEEIGEEETKEGAESGSTGISKIREDGFLVFKNLCKLSMKFSSQENDDQILLRGKTLSLELLKVVMDNGGSIWRSNVRFHNAIKQFLCLSLLKNSALSAMTIFQLQSSIFMSLLTKYRTGLKDEIGIFFPMLVLRVLENVLQPSFVQKMTVLNLMEKIAADSQIIVDIFVNYDCDVDSPNIFERIVNGLLKTALGPPPASTTTLSPVQDITFRHESMKCLVSIIKSMGIWMDQKLAVGDSVLRKSFKSDTSLERFSNLTAEDGTVPDYELQQEMNSELSNAATLEQRRAYKIELQKGVSLFNRKPSKGIEFLINTKKVGNSPEEVSSFLKNNTSGLNETMIGDYLGEREEFALKVMHAYVDSFDFKSMDFGEAIRFFLQGFRLPGEAQKIDRIMEKFAERYCKCNPNSFTSADTAYVLAYSVIMLNTDAHNSMVKEKMTKSDFIRNNRGIDDGKDLPEEYLGALYDQIVKNEIKMNANSSVPQSMQANSLNKLLGLDGILNLVSWKQADEKALGANGLLIRQIQEQFKAKSGKSDSVYHSVSDVAILRFMVEVCWGPMLAAFSVTLDQSDDRIATTQCLQGFRHAVHVTAVMGMQTQRDAFVTSTAKFTFLHCAADMKQKNVDAVKAIISIAIEDGNHLQEAWEHILTCLSRIEHLQLLGGEGTPTDTSILSVPTTETDEKFPKPAVFQSLKRKGSLQNPAVMAVVRGGSYDSTAGVNSSGLVTQEQINHFIANLNLLEQIGSTELNHVFVHSQRLNSEAIVAFVKALCKVSITELQSPTEPRVFSLTKLVEIAHYNMNRIRLVWFRIWNVLSDFFVSVGLSENLSVAIFVMDSLRQLAMKFLEREELANYNFQNEFLRPFVIVMQKSNSVEIRELIARYVSQMVLSRFSSVKSGWKSVFMVFTAAAVDERKYIVLIAFETMEKIVREYFHHVRETDAATFTDCVRCLIKFTNSRFDSDVSLNAISFLRLCAVKLAEGGLVCADKSSDDGSYISVATKNNSDLQNFADMDVQASFWIPLLLGLSELTSDSRLAIRKSSLEVLFKVLKDHGHLFSRTFWIGVFNSAVLPIFNGASPVTLGSPTSKSPHSNGSPWDLETIATATQSLVDLFISFYDVLRSQLPNLVSVLAGYLKSSIQGPASTGVMAMYLLTVELGSRLSKDEWHGILLAIKEAASATLPWFMKILRTMDGIKLPENSGSSTTTETSSEQGLSKDDVEEDNLQTAAYVISKMKSYIAVQLLIMQVITDMYKTNLYFLASANVNVIVETFSSITSHAQQLNSETALQKKIKKICSALEISEPPVVHFESEAYQNYLNFLQDLVKNNPSASRDMNLRSLVAVCEKILLIYLSCTDYNYAADKKLVEMPVTHWILPLGIARKEKMAARTPLLVSALKALSCLERDSCRNYIADIFHLLVDLVRSEHGSTEVQHALSNIFQACIGPIIMQ